MNKNEITKQNDAFAEQKSLKEDDMVQIRIAEIDQIAKNDVLKAFWLSYLLHNDYPKNKAVCKEFVKNFSNSFNLVNEKIEQGDWSSAFAYSQSLVKILKNTDLSFAEDQIDTVKIEEIFKDSKNKLYGSYQSYLKTPKNAKIEKMSKIIDGTVTIWVDLGVKIQDGYAYSNKAIGSGFFIDERGYLVTNYHVISSQVNPKYEGISKLYVKFADDTETRIPAKVVGYDKALDLALLKIEVSPKYVFPLGASKDLEIGDGIFAIGSPIGLEKTLTSGIVSAHGRQLFSIGTVMQLDAAINQGNSGGPIIDKNGNVQGIVFAGILEYEGLNFAIPVEYLKILLPLFYCGNEVKHSYLGIFGKTKKNEGVEVLFLETKGNAARSGLNKGDIITAVNGESIKNLEMLHRSMVSIIPGSIVDLTLKSGSEENGEKITLRNVSVFCGVRNEFPGLSIFKNESVENSFYSLFGMELERNSGFYRNKYIVKSVIKGSIADEAGFSQMDPVQVLKLQVSEIAENQVLIAKIYSKKKSNGYLDCTLVLPCVLDSETLF
ncbi:MAG: S1C family serine protease [Treponemataceae bacterium]